VVDHLRGLRRVEKLNLVAWSQGGPRAGGFAAKNPDKIARLVILAPNYIRERTNDPAKSPDTGQLGPPGRLPRRRDHRGA